MDSLTKIKILLVEDDEIDVRAFGRALRKSNINYSLEVCVYADEALKLLNNSLTDFDCIFVDYQLPGMDGLTLLQEIKSLGFDHPVLVMTSQGDEKIAVEMMKNGAFDYFPKADLSSSKIVNLINAIKHFNKVTHEKKRIETTLNQQKLFTEAVTNHSPNIIYVLNLKSGKFIYVNRSVFEELGYSKDEIRELGDKVFERTVNPDHLQIVSDHLKKLSKSPDGVIHEVEYQIKSADGKWVWYYNRDIVFKRDENNNVAQILGSTINISNIKKVESDLRIAKQEAEKAARVKSEFLSNMSHEIRTPMNAIIGLTDLLLTESHSTFVEENLKSIKQSADNLLVIINDILDFSKIEAGKMVIESIDFDLKYQLEHICKMMAHKAREKGLAFETIMDEKIPKFLVGDPFRLNQIIINLAGNAIKFTKIGFVKIEALLREDKNESIKLEISVKDSGIGIPEDKQQTIFESFTQAGTDTSRFFGGTGLGLTITSQLVKLMDGEINVNSAPDVGSEFIVVLTFKKSTVSKIVKEIVADSEQNIKGLRILVVEDNKINQKVITQILKTWDCDFEVAENGREGLLALSKNSFDIVLMDLQMPVLDGFETAKLIRHGVAGSKIKQIPIIALTADAFPETRNKVFETGMNDFVSKPFKKGDLNNKIHSLVSIRRR
ncbi:MAG: response regulator [Bacteroidales bacterium]|nr:response regulator [Bacteroidales bacterium]